MKNWIAYLLQAIQYVPVVVHGVEALTAGAKAGATKKQLALGALGLAASQIENFVPTQYQQTAYAASQLAAQAIDDFVSEANANGTFKTSTSAAAPAQVVQASTPVPAQTATETPAPVQTSPVAEVSSVRVSSDVRR